MAAGPDPTAIEAASFNMMEEEMKIRYRGFEIDPVADPHETGAWNVCTVAEATHFRIYPPNKAEPALDCAPETIPAAMLAIDEELDRMTEIIPTQAAA